MNFEEFEARAKLEGLTAIRFSDYHWQLKGCIRPVNYYPAYGTIYVNGQKQASQWGPPEEAIMVALEGPKAAKGAYRRGLTRAKRALWKAQKGLCNWCKQKVKEKEATIDHLVPRSRGGSNKRENLVMSCIDCNSKRGNNWKPPVQSTG
jgi:5-methylcytosine-specific restriction endonuclease McrA